jgi:hypothetical protein
MTGFAVETAFVTTWMAPIPGQGKKGFELIVQLEKYWGNQAVQGNCSMPDVFLLPNGPGAVTVNGRRQVLEKLTRNENLHELLATGHLLFQDWHCRFVDAGRRTPGSWRRRKSDLRTATSSLLDREFPTGCGPDP